jgi:diguanylate cyclase (GGDEF)-like protein/PAS domain S-box-containing protein
MQRSPRILILEDRAADAELACRELRSAGLEFEHTRVDTKDGFVRALREFDPDLVLSDFSLPQFTGLDALRILKQSQIDKPFILCTGAVSEETAVECMKEGAVDYVLKTSLKRLPSAVTNALETHETRTAKEHALQALRESEEKFRSIVETTAEWIWASDPLGRLSYSNPAVEQILGYRSDELEGVNMFELLIQDDRENLQRAFSHYVCQRQGWSQLAARFRHKDQTTRYLESTAVPVFGEDGELVGYRGTSRDVTDRKRAEAELRDSEERYRLLFDRNPHPVCVFDAETRKVLAVNEEAVKRYGYSRDEFLRLTIEDIELPAETWELDRSPEYDTVETELHHTGKHRTKYGTVIDVEVAAQRIVYGGIAATIALITDITEKKHAQEQLLHDAYHDRLTGLPNRTLFLNHLQLAIERSKRDGSAAYAVLYLGCDRFKVINGSLGHEKGDQLLRLLAKRLEQALQPGDLVARFGGDEFMILLDQTETPDAPVRASERLLEALKEPFALYSENVVLSATVGISIGKMGDESSEDKLREAAIAMHSAKVKGRGSQQVFEQQTHQFANRKLQIESQMRNALENGEFVLHYQPIVDLRTDQIAGFESLIRWNHPEWGLTGPGDFIPVAEESGFILQLGQWVLEQSCRQLRSWQERGGKAGSLSMSVNLSCKQFLQHDLVESIENSLVTSGIAPRHLKLEITESHVMENSELAIALLQRLRGLGCEISLDDFGTGYCSLSYLHRLPVNFLKIDRSFVSRINESAKNNEIVQTIIKLAKSFRLRVVAEGIETERQMKLLSDLSCDFGQGYFLSKPLEPAEAERLIEHGRIPCPD